MASCGNSGRQNAAPSHGKPRDGLRVAGTGEQRLVGQVNQPTALGKIIVLLMQRV